MTDAAKLEICGAQTWAGSGRDDDMQFCVTCLRPPNHKGKHSTPTFVGGYVQWEDKPNE